MQETTRNWAIVLVSICSYSQDKTTGLPSGVSTQQRGSGFTRQEELQLIPTPRNTETSANRRHLYKTIRKKIVYLSRGDDLCKFVTRVGL